VPTLSYLLLAGNGPAAALQKKMRDVSFSSYITTVTGKMRPLSCNKLVIKAGGIAAKL